MSMARADYYLGFTIEGDEEVRTLKIDGRPVANIAKAANGKYAAPDYPEAGEAATIYDLGQKIVENSKEFDSEWRQIIKETRLNVLRRGVHYWNAWRRR